MILVQHFFVFIKGASCGCSGGGPLSDLKGCIIDHDEPPPPGYKCECNKNDYILFSSCVGHAKQCSSVNDYGCSGCTGRECCIGNCLGYD